MATRSPGQRAGLSREAVIAAARAVADREGLERLSMRSLAAELGVMPNTLYSHVADKSELLDGLLDDVLGDIDTPEEGDWRSSLVAVLDSTRAVLLEHPGLIPAFLTRPTRGENAMRLGAVCLDLLAHGGVDESRAVQAFRALLIFTIGFAAYEAPRLHDPDPAGRAAAGAEAFRSSGHARSAQQAERLAAMPAAEDFHAGLDWILDGLLATGPQAK
jgi:TetR/AcrR family transcriptional regulator, tetracycline repressor protein